LGLNHDVVQLLFCSEKGSRGELFVPPVGAPATLPHRCVVRAPPDTCLTPIEPGRELGPIAAGANQSAGHSPEAILRSRTFSQASSGIGRCSNHVVCTTTLVVCFAAIAVVQPTLVNWRCRPQAVARTGVHRGLIDGSHNGHS